MWGELFVTKGKGRTGRGLWAARGQAVKGEGEVKGLGMWGEALVRGGKGRTGRGHVASALAPCPPGTGSQGRRRKERDWAVHLPGGVSRRG